MKKFLVEFEGRLELFDKWREVSNKFLNKDYDHPGGIFQNPIEVTPMDLMMAKRTCLKFLTDVQMRHAEALKEIQALIAQTDEALKSLPESKE